MEGAFANDIKSITSKIQSDLEKERKADMDRHLNRLSSVPQFGPTKIPAKINKNKLHEFMAQTGEVEFKDGKYQLVNIY